MNSAKFGRYIRRERRRLGLRQAELAALANVGTRFLSELENGKPTVELERALVVASLVGLDVIVGPRTWRHLDDLDD